MGELEALRARVLQLEGELSAAREREAEALSAQRMLQRVIDALPPAVAWKDRDCVYLGANRRFVENGGEKDPATVIGKTDHDFPWREQAELYRENDRLVMESGQPRLHIIEPTSVADEPTKWVETNKMPLCDDAGRVIGVVVTYQDITAHKEAEEALSSDREALIAAQAALLSELSTPLLPIHEKVLVMPLIGRLDEDRARIVMERLLEGIVAQQAEAVIIDLTGLPAVDNAVASGVLSAARAVELIGARVILTGIRPELAKTMVELGLDLGKVRTFGTLRDGVKYATGRGAGGQ